MTPLLARIEHMALSGPAIALSLETGILLPLKVDAPGLLPLSDALAGTARVVSEYALVECLRGRFGTRRVYGIDWVAEHRPEHAWCRRIDRPASGIPDGSTCPVRERPLWLLPKPQKRWSQKRCQTPFSWKKGSDPFSAAIATERIESGWWDGRDIRRDYRIVVGADGEKLWFYRDCLTHEWYLHGIFG